MRRCVAELLAPWAEPKSQVRSQHHPQDVVSLSRLMLKLDEVQRFSGSVGIVTVDGLKFASTLTSRQPSAMRKNEGGARPSGDHP
jgi:hypothetical protein